MCMSLKVITNACRSTIRRVRSFGHRAKLRYLSRSSRRSHQKNDAEVRDRDRHSSFFRQCTNLRGDRPFSLGWSFRDRYQVQVGLIQWRMMPRKNQPKASVSEYYGDGFYKSQMDGSSSSARRFVDHLSLIFEPRSVVDLGCGRGTWPQAFKACGAERVVGFDGSWNRQDNMVDQSIAFFSVDLNKPIAAQEEK
jgi:hypothetical protein